MELIGVDDFAMHELGTMAAPVPMTAALPQAAPLAPAGVQVA
jgi:hypothetical protein